MFAPTLPVFAILQHGNRAYDVQFLRDTMQIWIHYIENKSTEQWININTTTEVFMWSHIRLRIKYLFE